MKKLTKEDAGVLRTKLAQKDVAFFFIPSAKLCDMVAKNEHPLIKTLPDAYKAMFLEDGLTGKRSAPLIQSEMVVQYLEGTLNAANKFILDNGEIRTIDNSLKINIIRKILFV